MSVDVDSLEAARHLAEAGVPLFLAPPSKTNKLGFKLPEGWERTEADPTVVDRWRPGWALCAVMGHTVDAIDVDPRNGGSLVALAEALGGDLPTIYGKASTPSGGEHYLVASMGVRKVQNVVPGVDIQAGNAEGAGRGFIFLAPTVRESKADGVARAYEWELEPDLGLLLLEDDETVAPLAELVNAKHGAGADVEPASSYDGPDYDDLDYEKQIEASQHLILVLDLWKKRFEEAVQWPEGQREDGPKGRGWEGLTYEFAWAMAKLAACPWVPCSEEDAEQAFHSILPPEIAEACPGKWYDGIVEKAESHPVDNPPWFDRISAEEDFADAVRSARELPPCDHTNEAHVTRWLIRQVGQGPLSGLFLRGDEDLVYTPRIGEDGYEPPTNPDDHDGPVQVRRMTPLKLAARVDASYRVFRTTKTSTIDMVFKRELAERVMADLDRCPNLKRVAMVSHTPLVRADGTVLDDPGYDAESRVLYLPENGLHVAPVPDEPTAGDVAAARELLLDNVLVDFPFVTDHDRANYLGCLLLPLLRLVVPPPYQMLIIGAPQRGSGKSLLAYVMRTVHGGVFRSEIPDTEDERRKVITSILDGTSAPVVQFDNVNGVLKSSTMDGLLTNAVWTDRRLGVNQNVIVPNDRLWVVTGNNVHIGGDMDRRVLWSTINANLEHPELRPPTSFKHSDLEGWVRDHRGEVLHALLVLIRDWAVQGMPVEEAPTSDSFGKALQTMRGVLATAGIPGQVGHQESKPDRPDLEAEEWSTFLGAVRRVMGDQAWTTKQLMETLSEFADEDEGLRPDELPGTLPDKVRTNPHGVAKSLGKLLSSHQGQWVGGLKVENVGGGGKNAVKWHVTDEV